MKRFNLSDVLCFAGFGALLGIAFLGVAFLGYVTSDQYRIDQEEKKLIQRQEEAPNLLHTLGEKGKEDKYLGAISLPIILEYMEEPSYIDAVMIDCETESGSCAFPDSASGESIYMTVFTEEGEEKWQVTHGLPGQDYKVREGYKLVSCFCDQPECLVESPEHSLYWVEEILTIGETLEEGQFIKGIRLFYKK